MYNIYKFQENQRTFLSSLIQNHKLETIFEKSHRSSVILKIVGATPQLVQNFTPIRKLACTFSSVFVIGRYIMYNICKFQENQRTFLSSLTHSLSLSLSLHSLHSQPACGMGLRQLGLSACRRWRSLASRYGFWGRRLWHRTCKTRPGCLGHRTCKTSPGWLPGVKALAQNVQD